MRGTIRLTAVVAMLLAAGCFSMRPSSGGRQNDFDPPRTMDASDIARPPGYSIEPVARGFTFPTGVAFDDAGRPHVIEAGYS